MFETSGLTAHMYAITTLYGSSVLVAGFLIRLLPDWVDEHLEMLKVSEEVDMSDNAIMKAYNDNMTGKVKSDLVKGFGGSGHPQQPQVDGSDDE